MRFSIAILALAVLGSLAGPAFGQRSRWVQTDEWSGTDSRTTPLFHVNGARWRLLYRASRSRTLAFRVHTASGELLEEGTRVVRGPFRGTKRLTGRGHYYLEVSTTDNDWSMVLEQFLTTIEEWQLMQERKAPPAPLTKLASWYGEAGRHQHEFEVPAANWKLIYKTTGEGIFELNVAGAANNAFPGFNVLRTAAGRGETWGHQAGPFTLDIEADGTTWLVEVFYEE